jgi:hypothetical protein
LETSTPTRAKDALRAITVFFYAMIVGMLMFTVIISVLSLLLGPPLPDQSEVRIFFMAVLVIAGISLLMAPRLYKKRITDALSQGMTLMDKLTIYRSALILYLALCEGAGIFAVIVYFLTGYRLLLIIIGVVLLAMLMKRPEKSKIFNELQLSSQEQLELN